MRLLTLPVTIITSLLSMKLALLVIITSHLSIFSVFIVKKAVVLTFLTIFGVISSVRKVGKSEDKEARKATRQRGIEATRKKGKEVNSHLVNKSLKVTWRNISKRGEKPKEETQRDDGGIEATRQGGRTGKEATGHRGNEEERQESQ